MKIHGRIIAGIALVFLAGCGNEALSPVLLGNSSLDGTWDLAGVTCDGADSNQLTPGLALDSVGSSVTFHGTTGNRIWNIDMGPLGGSGTCTITTPVIEVSYPTAGVVRLATEATQLSSACLSGFALPAAPSTDFHYSLSGNMLQVVMPPEELARNDDPCPGQPKNTVIFTYIRLN